MSNNSYSAKYNVAKKEELQQKLEDEGFSFKPMDHAFWRAQKNNVAVTLYKSGKILVQGKDTQEFITRYLGVTNQLSIGIAATPTKHESWIGTDESGKGDYFGPLIIAGVLIDNDNIQKIQDLGVKDSKKMSDAQIEKIAWQIKNNSTFSVVTINPAKYNQLYNSFKNLNKLLAWGHARAIENILEKKVSK